MDISDSRGGPSLFMHALLQSLLCMTCSLLKLNLLRQTRMCIGHDKSVGSVTDLLRLLPAVQSYAPSTSLLGAGAVPSAAGIRGPEQLPSTPSST